MPSALLVPDLLHTDLADGTGRCARAKLNAEKLRRLGDKVCARASHPRRCIGAACPARPPSPLCAHRPLPRVLCVAQENVAPNILAQQAHVGANGAPPQARAKRVAKAGVSKRKTKTAAAQVAARAAQAHAAATTAGDAQSGEVGTRSGSPQPSTQRQPDGGSQAVLVRYAGVRASGAACRISPPLAKVQERHLQFAMRAKAVRERGPSALGVHTAAELDWLSRDVSCWQIAPATES